MLCTPTELPTMSENEREELSRDLLQYGRIWQAHLTRKPVGDNTFSCEYTFKHNAQAWRCPCEQGKMNCLLPPQKFWLY